MQKMQGGAAQPFVPCLAWQLVTRWKKQGEHNSDEELSNHPGGDEIVMYCTYENSNLSSDIETTEGRRRMRKQGARPVARGLGEGCPISSFMHSPNEKFKESTRNSSQSHVWKGVDCVASVGGVVLRQFDMSCDITMLVHA